MRLYVMTGLFQTGKTTWINKMIPLAHQRGIDLRGVVTPAIFEEGEKTGIAGRLLPGAEVFQLATKRTAFDECVDPTKGKLGWDFDQQRMEQINLHLAGCRGARLFVVDELGPLEMLRGQGYTNALKLLDEGAATCALAVIRPSLIDEAARRWGAFETLTPESDVGAFLDAVAGLR